MKKARVFIPQEPMKKDSSGKWVSKGLNLAAATDFGEIVIVWSPDTSVLTRVQLVEDAHRVAEEYNEDIDYIVALGSPSLIAMLSWSIGTAAKRLRMLEWDRNMGRYYPTLNGPYINEKG